jgi:serine/threonine-protein kinase
MEIKLEVVKGPDKGNVFTLNEATTCLAGRSEESRFRFSEKDPYISRRHFLLEAAPPKVYFKDLDVTNPSRINDQYIAETELSEGDIIEVGFTKLKVFLKLGVATKIIHCEKCGKSIEIFENEDPNQICTDCRKDISTLPQIKISLPPEKPDQFHLTCHQCGKDLAKLANSDGRARELRNNVTYCCAKCLPSKGEDADRKINEYTVITKLGEGGMGKVYLAYHKSTARLVAVKVMNTSNRSLGARFEREIRVMQRMIHDNVLYYIDSGQDKKSGKPYLVMEYASRGSLENLLEKKKGRLSVKESLEYIHSTLNGLEFIHNKQWIHRDIKPENILLKGGRNGIFTPKIADFGLAKCFNSAGGSNLTQHNQALGTILYMPPEQIRDARSVRETADLYSTGVTLYYLLTGKYPFNFPTPHEIFRFINENKHRAGSPNRAIKLMMEIQRLKTPHLIVLEDQPIPVKERISDLSSDLAFIVDKAISKDISKRYQTASAFRKKLETCMS